MNSRKIYLIYTPGRTGSHIILESISGINNTIGGLCDAQCYWYPTNSVALSEYSQTSNLAIHTHNLQSCVQDLELLPKDTTLILSLRRNLFAQAMSMFVAEITNEWNGKDYSSKTVPAQHVRKEKFLELINFFKSWPGQIHNLNEYKSVISIYYEDLEEQGSQHVAEKLNVVFDIAKLGKVHGKSPHHYKDCVLNWEELYQEYVALSNQT